MQSAPPSLAYCDLPRSIPRSPARHLPLQNGAVPRQTHLSCAAAPVATMAFANRHATVNKPIFVSLLFTIPPMRIAVRSRHLLKFRGASLVGMMLPDQAARQKC